MGQHQTDNKALTEPISQFINACVSPGINELNFINIQIVMTWEI